VLVSVGVIVGALVLTSGVLEGRYDLHMRAAQAEGLTADTRVSLQGLEVGRVRDVTPYIDPTTSALGFIARVSIRERFADGTRLSLPRGTRARITEAGLVGGTEVQLEMPVLVGGDVLQPGDTIDSERVATTLEALGTIAEELSDDVAATLVQTRLLVAATTGTLDEARFAIAEITPQISTVLDRLAGTMDRTDDILAEIGPRVGPMADSVMATLGDTRMLVSDMQTLVDTATSMTNRNAAVFADIMQSFERTAEVLAYFADQVSRRPMRMFTGVTPPDSTENQ
jgi:ABC-type transporter Mla subunit MlaD